MRKVVVDITDTLPEYEKAEFDKLIERNEEWVKNLKNKKIRLLCTYDYDGTEIKVESCTPIVNVKSETAIFDIPLADDELYNPEDDMFIPITYFGKHPLAEEKAMNKIMKEKLYELVSD